MADTPGLARLAADTLEGLWNRRNPRVVDERIVEDYVQHNPSIPNGAAPVRAFVESLAGVRQPIIDVKRAIAEGDLAMVHSHYAWTPAFELDGGRGSAVVDIFRFGSDGRIVEHWDVARAVTESIANDNTMLDGGGNPAVPTSPQERAANHAVAARWFDVVRSSNTAAFAEVIAADCVQHNPHLPNGLEPIQRLFRERGPLELQAYRTVAQGDLVMVHYHYKAFNMAGVDIFRLENGLIVEMWDVVQEIPASTASGNDMFAQLS